MRRRRSGINPRGTAAEIIEVAPPLFLKPHKKQEASGLPAYMASGRLVYHNNAFSLTG